MASSSLIVYAFAIGLGSFATPAAAAEAEARAVHPPCLPQSETREAVKARHLLEPFAVLKTAATQLKAEALSAKLCHIGDEFVYEIALLHRDGRYVHVIMNASTGRLIESRRSREASPKKSD